MPMARDASRSFVPTVSRVPRTDHHGFASSDRSREVLGEVLGRDSGRGSGGGFGERFWRRFWRKFWGVSGETDTATRTDGRNQSVPSSELAGLRTTTVTQHGPRT